MAPPRWGGRDVDSSAMLSAYLHWASTAESAEVEALFPHLWMVDHRFELATPPAPRRVRGMEMPTRPCSEEGCERCAHGWGGYQFRWIDRRWLVQYELLRRPGSWTSRGPA